MLVAIKGDLGHPLTAGEQEMVVSATTLGAMLGSIIAGKAADWLGRKKVIVVAALLFLLGSLEQTASQDVPQLILGRLIVGIAVGQAAAVVPIYLAEFAPSSLRGKIVGMNCLLITGGQVLAYTVNAILFPLSHSWRWMAVASALPALAQLFGLFTLDESPRWLVNKGRFIEARRVMKKVYPMTSEEQVQLMLDRIFNSLKANQGEESSPADQSAQSSNSTQYNERQDEEQQLFRTTPRDQRSKWAQLFFEPQNRRALILAAGLQAFQQATGFNALMYYSSRLLLIAGFKSNPNSFAILIAVANFAGTLIAMRLADLWGRRKLLLWTTALMCLCLALIAVFFELIGEDFSGVVDDPTSVVNAPTKPSASSVFDSFVRPSSGASNPSVVTTAAVTAIPSARTSMSLEEFLCRLPQASVWHTSSPSLLARAAQSAGPNACAVFSLCFMVLFTLSYASGQGSVPWLVLSEIFSGQVRSLGSSLASCANWSMNLLWSATYLSLVEKVGGPGKTFAIFAVISLAAWLFAYLMLPELTGVSINEVGRAFGGDSGCKSKSAAAATALTRNGRRIERASGEDEENQGLLYSDNTAAESANERASAE